MRVKVIGIGGIGEALLPALVRFLNFHDSTARLTLIDGDRYEERNRERQSFDRIGNKAEVKTGRLRADHPTLSIKAEAGYVTPVSAEYLIEEGDIVLLCVDNHKTRSFVSEFCQGFRNVTLISGGNDYTDGNIQVYVRRNGEDLTLPLGNKYHPEIASPQDKSPHELGCGEAAESQPQLIFTNNLVAALMLNAFYACLQDRYEYDEVYADLLTNNCRAVNRRQQP